MILSVLIHGAKAEWINTKKRIPIAFVAIFGAWKKRTKLVCTNIAQKSQICYNESIKKTAGGNLRMMMVKIPIDDV